MNNQIILHRSLKSPYSQKAMLMLDYENLEWKSVLSSKGVPRPIQEKLVGEYSRRIPVLQVGADLYCDTDMIAKKIAELSGDKNLDRLNFSEEIQKENFRVEDENFMALLGSMSLWNFIVSYLKSIKLKNTFELITDRAKASRGAVNPLKIRTKAEWAKILENDLPRLDKILEENNFLLKTDKPTFYDFTVFTSIWYMDFLNEVKILDKCTNLKAWLTRMNEFSNNHIEEINPIDSLNIAKENTPLPISDELKKSDKIGKPIAVEINDSIAGALQSKLTGILVGEDDYKYIVKRENETVGTVHVHIPKQCYGACG